MFQASFQRKKNRKTDPKAPKKTTKFDPIIHKNDIGGNRFLQDLRYENLDLGVPSIEISTQKTLKNMTWEQARN